MILGYSTAATSNIKKKIELVRYCTNILYSIFGLTEQGAIFAYYLCFVVETPVQKKTPFSFVLSLSFVQGFCSNAG